MYTANIPSRTLKFGDKNAAAMIQAITDVTGSADQTGLGEDIPRPIGYDAAAEAAKAAKVAKEEEAKAAEAEAETTATSDASLEESATGAQETAEEPSATNLMGSAEGLSDVEGVEQVVEKADEKQS